ncbi:membrane protein [Nocardioides halotolerans]|uniref:membrane protein n=1 Tax=Nocardioides halotolerans TaxID=433660 RepID=UPI000408EA03|nr:membrane protein [Nocardioides halotolerans]
MSDHRPVRVRVTGPPLRRHAPRARTGDIDEQTALGDVFLSSLLREQLALAVRILALLALTVGSLPLVFHLFPGLADVEVLWVPVTWLLLGVVVYPWLVLLGLRFVRRAERNERDFALLLEVMEE